MIWALSETASIRRIYLKLLPAQFWSDDHPKLGPEHERLTDGSFTSGEARLQIPLDLVWRQICTSFEAIDLYSSTSSAL